MTTGLVKSKWKENNIPALPELLYGAEVWTRKTKNKVRNSAVEMKFVTRMVTGISKDPKEIQFFIFKC
jgi:hypothetical protein